MVDDQNRDDGALEVFRYVEALVGEGRYGGGWIDRGQGSPGLGIALVAPETSEVASIRDEAQRKGWPVTIDVVRYSRAQLISFYDDLGGPGDALVSFGWDPRLNKVVVDLSAPDTAALAYFRERIPEDALLFRYVPWRAIAL